MTGARQNMVTTVGQVQRSACDLEKTWFTCDWTIREDFKNS